MKDEIYINRNPWTLTPQQHAEMKYGNKRGENTKPMVNEDEEVPDNESADEYADEKTEEVLCMVIDW